MFYLFFYLGPHTWNCSDENQSPINIIESDVRQFPIRELLTWNHYDDLPSGVMLENNGHTGKNISVKYMENHLKIEIFSYCSR